MKSEVAESEVVEELPAAKPKLSIVVILAMVLGALLVVGVFAVIMHVQTSKSLKSEVLALKKELTEKDLAYEDMTKQVEALSRQIELLKENAIASSSGAGGRGDPAAVKPGPQAANVPLEAGKLAEGQEKTAPEEPAPPPRVKKPKSDKPNCELVGKSKEEQEETLKRCVSLVDPPK